MRGLVGEQPGCPGECLPHTRVEVGREVGQQLVPHAVAPMDELGVRRVLAERQPPLAQMREHVLARRLEQRPHDVAAAQAHPREAGRPGPAQQPQQQRLGLIVPRVGDRDRDGRLFLAHAAQERVALAPRRLLEAAPVPLGAGAHVGGADPDRHAEAGAQRCAEGGVVGRAGAQPVVEVRGHEPKAPRTGERREGIQERDRVGAARERDDQLLAARGRARGPQGAGDRRDEGRELHGASARARSNWWRCRDLNPGRRGYEPRALTS